MVYKKKIFFVRVVNPERAVGERADSIEWRSLQIWKCDVVLFVAPTLGQAGGKHTRSVQILFASSSMTRLVRAAEIPLEGQISVPRRSPVTLAIIGA